MTKTIYLVTLKKIFQFGCLFMVGETIYHFSGIRMMGTSQIWPIGAVEFAKFFMFLWASASLLISGLLYLLQKNLTKYADVIIWIGYFSLFHSSLLWWCATRNYEQIFPLSTLYFWNAYYSYQLVIEGLALFGAGMFIIYGRRHQYI